MKTVTAHTLMAAIRTIRKHIACSVMSCRTRVGQKMICCRKILMSKLQHCCVSSSALASD